MTEPKFVHLHVHTDYSMIDGIMDVSTLVKKAASMDMAAIAVTDHMNQCNMVKLFEDTRKVGIKPIFGIELCVRDDTNKKSVKNEFFELTMLAMNQVGYRNIVELQSDGWRAGEVDYHAHVDFSWLDKEFPIKETKYSEGVIVLSGGMKGDIGSFLVKGRRDLADERIEFYKKNYPNRYYIELSRLGFPDEEFYIAEAVKFARDHDLPVVATNPVMFPTEDDYEIHRIRVAIQDKVTLDDKNWHPPYTPKMYMRSVDEMCELFADIPEALENSVQIAKRCNVSLSLGKNYLPKFPTGDLSDAEYLRREAYKGLDERLEFLYPDPKEREIQRPRYVDRLETELGVIIKMDFPGYFLIVMEFIQWSKKNGVPVGPGRGSGGGSLVAYAIRITDFDPLRFNLLFERFLNPERVSMPDFDVDFCMDNRGRVIQHVADLYGRESVSQIITFGTLAARASIKSVARVLGKSYSFGDNLAKLIPQAPDMTIGIAMTGNKKHEPSAEFNERYNNDEEAREVVDIALRLEGLTTSHGKHAGGVVISPTIITDFAPLMCDEYGGNPKTQFDKHDVEEAGLVKFDFLGLRTLTIIDWAVEMIDERLAREGQKPLDIARIDLADIESYRMLQSGETTAVFQLESAGMRELIVKMQPDCIEDVIALLALYRPGPLDCGMVQNFVNRKRGQEEVSYPDPNCQHECLKKVLEPTYGIIVYQEQVMQIAREMAGYSLGGADILRRAMGKKIAAEMERQRGVFKAGAESKGIDGDLALKIFDLVEKFAGYGFNKSHSAAYAIVTFQTLWLKTHYPAEFLAAMMTADKENTPKIVLYVNECRRLNIAVDPPDVNQGEIHFIVNREGHIVFSLGAIKGVGEGPVGAIMEARKSGPFKNIFDFCRRVEYRFLSRRIMEALIKAGALDNLGPSRAAMMQVIDVALKLGNEASKDRSNGTVDLFMDCGLDDFTDPPFPDVQEYPDKIWLAGEVETLGLYLTGHPIARYAEELKNFISIQLGEVRPTRRGYGQEREYVTIAGVVTDMELRRTKDGTPFISGAIVDYSGRVNFSLWREQVNTYSDWLENDMLVVIKGSIAEDQYAGGNKVFVEEMYGITAARLSHGRVLRLVIDDDCFKKKNFVTRLHQVLDRYSGTMPLEVTLERGEGMMTLPSNFTVEPCDELIDELKFLCGTRVGVSY